MLENSDRALAVVKDLFGDDPKVQKCTHYVPLGSLCASYPTNTQGKCTFSGVPVHSVVCLYIQWCACTFSGVPVHSVVCYMHSLLMRANKLVKDLLRDRWFVWLSFYLHYSDTLPSLMSQLLLV